MINVLDAIRLANPPTLLASKYAYKVEFWRIAWEPVMVVPFTTPTLGTLNPLKIWLSSGELPPARVVSKACRIPLFDGIQLIDIGALQQFGSLASHIADIDRQPARDFPRE